MPKPSRALAILESIVATLIWASSFIIAKFGIGDVGPLSLAGLRYTLAGLLLLPLLFGGLHSIRHMPARLWWRLALIGLLAHGIGNGAIFWGLNYLPPTTLTFLSCFLPVFILVLGVVQLRELPTRIQVIGLVLTLGGSLLFFVDGLSGGQLFGLIIALLGLLSFSVSTIYGRIIARDRQTSTLALTGLPLLFGGLPLLVVALTWEGEPHFTWTAGWVILALTLFNTILAYLLYNHSMQVLTAFETNVFLNLSPLGSALLEWWFFDAQFTAIRLVGMIVVIIGVTLVQWQRTPAPTTTQGQQTLLSATD